MPRLPCMLVAVLALACGDPSSGGGYAGAAGADPDGGFGNAGQSGQGTLTGGASGAGAGGGGGDGCAREVRLTAVAIGEPPPFDVIIVADHSQSLSWSRDDLAAGLSTLLADVRGRAARFFVLTPTQYGASSSEAINRFNGQDLVLWRDAASGEAFENQMTSYAQSCTDATGTIDCPEYTAAMTTPFALDGAWSFEMPEAIAEITPEMTDAEIAAQQQAISDEILNLSGTGSPNEQPLCTLNRYLLHEPSMLPEHAVFIVISDEDDATSPEDCVSAYHYEVRMDESMFGEACSESCDIYQYYLTVNALRQPIEFTCVPLDDLGVPQPEGAFTSNTWLNGSLASDCTAVAATGPCGSGGLDWAEQQCGAGHIVESCSSSCEEAETASCSLQTTEDNPDFCTAAFTHEGVSYPSMFDYCDQTVGAQDWLSCQRQGYLSGTQTYGTQTVTPLVMGTATDVLITAFRNGANTQFGMGGYFVEVIGHAAAFDCTLGQGQSLASNLSQIATSPDDVFPICHDYADALDRVAEFASYLVDTELELVLEANEAIETVQIEGADGSRRPLDPSRYTYDRARGLLLLQPDALGPTDVGLSVEVEKTCGPE